VLACTNPPVPHHTPGAQPTQRLFPIPQITHNKQCDTHCYTAIRAVKIKTLSYFQTPHASYIYCQKIRAYTVISKRQYKTFSPPIFGWFPPRTKYILSSKQPTKANLLLTETFASLTAWPSSRPPPPYRGAMCLPSHPRN